MTSVQDTTAAYSVAQRRGGPIEVALSPDSAETSTEGEWSVFGSDGFTFGDLVDTINPLQHIPVISTLYREQTGDDIAPGPRVVGSTLFFGPLGIISALANIAVEESTGKDIGAHVADWTGFSANANQPAIAETENAPLSFDPDDPVSVWARGEIDWAQNGEAPAALPVPPTLDADPEQLPPDAGPLLAQQERWAARADRPTDVAILSDDIRAASRAYMAVANLPSMYSSAPSQLSSL